MNNKFLKPTLGVVCAMAFFMLSFTSTNASQVVYENQVTVSESSEFQNYASTQVEDDWYVLISSNWVLVGPI